MNTNAPSVTLTEIQNRFLAIGLSGIRVSEPQDVHAVAAFEEYAVAHRSKGAL